MLPQRKLLLLPLLSTIVAITFLGCSAYQRVSSVNRTFLEDVDTSAKIENLPFAHSAVYIEPTPGQYTNLYIKPTRPDLLPVDSWQSSASTLIKSRQDYLDKADEIARYCDKRLLESFKKYPEFRYNLVDDGSQPGTVILETAITEMELAHPLTNAAALASPVPGTGAAVSAISDPHIGLALRLTDAQSGQLIATAAERLFPPTRILDLNQLTVSSSAREICDIWTDTVAETLAKGRFAKVSKRGVFYLKPW